MIFDKPRVYCAGKIGQGDWRHDLFEGLRTKSLDWDYFHYGNVFDAAKNFIYGGPYFISCDHGCYHRDGAHGVGANGWTQDENGGCMGEFLNENQTMKLCRKWLGASDYVFAWIDSFTCFGTLVELGWASELKKPIFIYFKEEGLAKDMWFARTLVENSSEYYAVDAKDAWDKFTTGVWAIKLLNE